MRPDRREFLVLWQGRRPPFFVRWYHHTNTSSWWGSSTVWADDAQDAARKVGDTLDFDKHTTRDCPIEMHVHEISATFEKFDVARPTAVVRDA